MTNRAFSPLEAWSAQASKALARTGDLPFREILPRSIRDEHGESVWLFEEAGLLEEALFIIARLDRYRKRDGSVKSNVDAFVWLDKGRIVEVVADEFDETDNVPRHHDRAVVRPQASIIPYKQTPLSKG